MRSFHKNCYSSMKIDQNFWSLDKSALQISASAYAKNCTNKMIFLKEKKIKFNNWPLRVRFITAGANYFGGKNKLERTN
jgi:hypothetical protein